jgi:hypothetical protein
LRGRRKSRTYHDVSVVVLAGPDETTVRLDSLGYHVICICQLSTRMQKTSCGVRLTNQTVLVVDPQ